LLILIYKISTNKESAAALIAVSLAIWNSIKIGHSWRVDCRASAETEVQSNSKLALRGIERTVSVV